MHQYIISLLKQMCHVYVCLDPSLIDTCHLLRETGVNVSQACDVDESGGM